MVRRTFIYPPCPRRTEKRSKCHAPPIQCAIHTLLSTISMEERSTFISSRTASHVAGRAAWCQRSHTRVCTCFPSPSTVTMYPALSKISFIRLAVDRSGSASRIRAWNNPAPSSRSSSSCFSNCVRSKRRSVKSTRSRRFDTKCAAEWCAEVAPVGSAEGAYSAPLQIITAPVKV